MKVLQILVLAVLVVLGGCDTSYLYDGTIPNPKRTARWPDHVGTCGLAKTALVPLGIVITNTFFYRILEGAGGCGTPGRVYIDIKRNTERDPHGGESFHVGTMKVDGLRLWAAVRYGSFLKRNVAIEPNVSYTPDWASYTSSSVNRRGRWQYNVPIPTKHKTFESNGLMWHHDLFVGFYSFNDDPAQPGIPAAVGNASFVELPYPVIKTPQQRELQWLGEVYTLKVDDSHSMKIWASYSRPVTQDAHWLKVRRAMLRQLVEAVTIKPLTPERLDALREEKVKQSEILEKCAKRYPLKPVQRSQCLQEMRIQKGLK